MVDVIVEKDQISFGARELITSWGLEEAGGQAVAMVRKSKFQWVLGSGEKYPRLVPDTPDASRLTNAAVAQYVGLEDFGRPDAYADGDVRFIRSEVAPLARTDFPLR